MWSVHWQSQHSFQALDLGPLWGRLCAHLRVLSGDVGMELRLRETWLRGDLAQLGVISQKWFGGELRGAQVKSWSRNSCWLAGSRASSVLYMLSKRRSLWYSWNLGPALVIAMTMLMTDALMTRRPTVLTGHLIIAFRQRSHALRTSCEQRMAELKKRPRWSHFAATCAPEQKWSGQNHRWTRNWGEHFHSVCNLETAWANEAASSIQQWTNPRYGNASFLKHPLFLPRLLWKKGFVKRTLGCYWKLALHQMVNFWWRITWSCWSWAGGPCEGQCKGWQGCCSCGKRQWWSLCQQVSWVHWSQVHRERLTWPAEIYCVFHSQLFSGLW